MVKPYLTGTFPAYLLSTVKRLYSDNMDNNYSLIKNSFTMTAFNTSFLSSAASAANRVGKKVASSSKSNNYLVEVVDFDNEVSTYEVEAVSASEASEQAADMAMSVGVQVSYCNVYSEQ